MRRVVIGVARLSMVIAADVMCGTPAAAAAPGRRPFFLGSA
ncbi:hypothetical protein [Streptomyces sp. JW3]